MLNQFIIPTWLVVGVPLLILLGILVWFAIVWWRVRRGEEETNCVTVYVVDDDLSAFGDSFEDDEREQVRAEHERAMRRIVTMCRSARSAEMKGQNWREN
jgi:cytoskeletal protein RodZ